MLLLLRLTTGVFCRSLFAAGAPELGAIAPPRDDHEEDRPSVGAGGAQYNAVLEADAVFGNPYALGTMASAYGLGESEPEPNPQPAASAEACTESDTNGDAGDGHEDQRLLRSFQRRRSFSCLAQGGGDEPQGGEYLRLRRRQNYAHAAEAVARGVSSAKAGDYTAAMKHYSYALHIDVTHAEAYVAKGAAYANQDMLEKAVAQFEHALGLLPEKEEKASDGDAEEKASSGGPSAASQQRTRSNAVLYLAATRRKLAEKAREAEIAEEAQRMKRQLASEEARRKAEAAAAEAKRRRENEKPIPVPSLASMLSQMQEKAAAKAERRRGKKRKKEHKRKKHKKKKHKKHKKRRRKSERAEGSASEASDSGSSSS